MVADSFKECLYNYVYSEDKYYGDGYRHSAIVYFLELISQCATNAEVHVPVYVLLLNFWNLMCGLYLLHTLSSYPPSLISGTR